MRPIQLLLIASVLGSACLYFRQFRSQMIDRLIVVLVAGVGSVLVLCPEISSMAAAVVGVGRGADLVIYIGLVQGFFVMLLLLAKIRNCEARMAAIVRERAIATSEWCGKDVVERGDSSAHRSPGSGNSSGTRG
jgi:small membrane protein